MSFDLPVHRHSDVNEDVWATAAARIVRAYDRNSDDSPAAKTVGTQSQTSLPGDKGTFVRDMNEGRLSAAQIVTLVRGKLADVHKIVASSPNGDIARIGAALRVAEWSGASSIPHPGY